MRVGDAVAQGIINNQTLGYYVARTYLFLTSSGVDKKFLRFRQHLPTEMAHYACDCWDAEIYSSYGWLETVGIADRSCFDLTAHANATGTDLQYKEKLEQPIEKELLTVTKASGIAFMKAFKKDGKMMRQWVEGLDETELEKLQSSLQSGPSDVEVDGRKFTILPELLKCERTMQKVSVNAYTPGVIEPSFGIDRLFVSIMEHVFYARPKEDSGDDKQTRGVLSFAPSVAPYKCTILPLDQRISRSEKYDELVTKFRSELAALGLSYTIDESGATVGRRYSRNDELGVPFAVTFDFTTLEDSTVTLRERDSMAQVRLPLSSVANLVRDFCLGETTWESVLAGK
jgi:glycyl-tRNA synthetase